jgi:hypothetical protein
MDEVEARALQGMKIEELRKLSYADLVERVLEAGPRTEWVNGESGQDYQLEIQGFWDSGRRKKHLRVRVAVDDGGESAYSPLVQDFIIAPDGSFIGE